MEDFGRMFALDFSSMSWTIAESYHSSDKHKHKKQKPSVNTDSKPVSTNATPRKRGRPPGRKKPLPPKPGVPYWDPVQGMMVIPVKRPRGRPRKYPKEEADENTSSSSPTSSPSISSSNSSSEMSSSSTENSPSNSMRCMLPSDYEITTMIMQMTNWEDNSQAFPSRDEVRCKLEQHFGVDLLCRSMFIEEAYDLLCF